MSTPTVKTLALSNGLRVLIAPAPQAYSVAVSVHYGVGFRAEPPGLSGFAHLFEHLMFQGTRNIPPLHHFQVVEASGGTANGATYGDHTEYFQAVPPQALDRVLFLEAERMAGPAVTPEAIRSQIAVVREEIRTNIAGRPYGGFPWTVLPQYLYDSYAHGHNGYGEEGDLRRATVAACSDFFATYYVPANAVLTVVGDIDVNRVADRVERYFSAVPAGCPPAPIDRWADTGDDGGRRTARHTACGIPLPSIAVGYRLPDPRARREEYLAHVVLSALLSDGEAARLKRRATARPETLINASTSVGLFGPFHAVHPDTFVCVLTHPAGVGLDRVMAVLDTELADLADPGPTAAELRRAVARLRTSAWRDQDDILTRARMIGRWEILFNAGAQSDTLPSMLDGVGAEQVAAAARALVTGGRAVVHLLPEVEEVAAS